MNIIIKKAKIIDPTSPYNGQISDIHIANGKIVSIKKDIEVKAAQKVEAKGLHVSPGWIDIFSDFADPGFEYRETLETGARAAAAGGFTNVCVVPNTQPAIDQKSVVEYVVQKSKDLPVSIHPLGSVTRGAAGKELAEMYDMKLSGAVAFSDGKSPLQSAGILVKALQYIKSFDGVLIQIPDDKTISPNGLMNEGITSTRMGLAGRPAIAEDIAVASNIKLAVYAESKLHLTGVSTQTSLKLIKEAKQQKVDITCSATPYHLYFCDEDITAYDSNLKVNPPFRDKKDRKALQKAVADGLVDCIASHHIPQDKDHKVVEFEYAKNGMLGLQTTYSILNTVLPEVPQERWVELLALNARRILDIPVPTIDEGATASLTFFQPKEAWKFEQRDILSYSKNSPFVGKEFTGKPLGIYHKNKLTLNFS
ncbi:dihydroorotase [Niabella insulamsoli]|uniref:dihydroorotase n=1 Tax=Niabella insulamsoli TaxID=3144874 RepID=UPI0031FC92F4